jgi:hypothetical protein
MRGFPSSSLFFTFFTLIFRVLHSINDATVPYLTAYVDLEDPFINHSPDDLAVYANILL